jgi:hypothetical protein
MPNYTKLFNSIVTSTIWTEDDKTRIVWITMLAMSDQNGEVHASVPGLARVAGVTLADCELALGKLLGPDPYSRTPDNEGRRIAPIDGGWELLNHRKYRAMASREDEKKANAERQKRFRDRNAPITDSNGPITPHNGQVTGIVHIADTDSDSDSDTKADTETKPKREKKPKAQKLSDDEWMASLKTNPEYSGINIDSEFRRAHEWIAKQPDRKMSRPFFTKWLERCEKPLTIKPKPPAHVYGSSLGPTSFPKGHSYL